MPKMWKKKMQRQMIVRQKRQKKTFLVQFWQPVNQQPMNRTMNAGGWIRMGRRSKYKDRSKQPAGSDGKDSAQQRRQRRMMMKSRRNRRIVAAVNCTNVVRPIW